MLLDENIKAISHGVLKQMDRVHPNIEHDRVFGGEINVFEFENVVDDGVGVQVDGFTVEDVAFADEK